MKKEFNHSSASVNTDGESPLQEDKEPEKDLSSHSGSEFNLSEKRKELKEFLTKVFKDNLIQYNFKTIFESIEKQDKEFISKLKEIEGDDLAMWYKEHEEFMESLSSMEICNENHNCNNFVIEKLKARIDKLAGKEII